MDVRSLSPNALNSQKSPLAASGDQSNRGELKAAFDDILGKAQFEHNSTPQADTAKRAELPKKADTPKPADTPKRAEASSKRVDTSKREEKSAKAEQAKAPVRETGRAEKGPASVERRNEAKAATGPKEPVNKVVGAKEETVKADGVEHREQWNDFLKKMKDEFGVSAEDVLGAFQSLSAEELAKPPMENLDKVVMALGLNDQQALMARQYFQQLIQSTETVAQDAANSGKQVDLGLNAESALDAKNAQSTLERMNQEFFMNGPQSKQISPQAAKEALMNAASLKNGDAAKGINQDGKMADLLSQMEDVDTNDRSIDQMEDVDTNDRSIDQMVKDFMGSQASSSMLKKEGPAQANALANAAEAMMASVESADQAKAEKMLSSAEMMAGLQKFAEASADEEADMDGMMDASNTSGPWMNPNTQSNTAVKDGLDFRGTLAEKPLQPITVPDLVEKAQVMVREGGGDMKVTLHPEGLGQVAMKVSLDDGKVSVQMITESEEARKLIEHKLGDLKSSLASSNLQVTDIKVDTATNLGRQMEQQFQDAHRQATQMAWEQFRNDSQGWKRSFFETPSARVYKSQGDAPRDVQVPIGATAASRGLSSRRLDLVA